MIAWFADRPFKFNASFRIKSSVQAAASNQARLDANPDESKGISGLFAKCYAEVPVGETFEFEVPSTLPHEEKQFHGEIYILVNRHSYSNAANGAAMVQDYQLGTILGEKTSDLATTYGSMENFRLPHSDIEVAFPKAHIIRPSGDKKPDSVTPDITIETPITLVENDIVLEQAIQTIINRR